ncbi:MAG: AAA family ATPase [Gammaproteobacteria bacterium]|nr:AAA family ATPase [Gammaproteobacteria bacterium]
MQPTQDEIKSLHNPESATPEIRNFMSKILSNQKWQSLNQIKRQGKAKIDFVSASDENSEENFSEKNFSLGELCLLRLGEKLINTNEKSLILIEEIDMTLHPKAQVKLYDELKEVAEKKGHTILVSSHSPYLIKKACPGNAILLERNSFSGVTVTDKQPISKALGEIVYNGHDLLIDIIYFVEDEQARLLLHNLIQEYIKLNQNKNLIIPTFEIILVGEYSQVIKMCEHAPDFTAKHIRKYCFLDKDVENHDTVRSSCAKILPAVLEVGLINFLESRPDIPNLSNRFRGIIELTEYQSIQESDRSHSDKSKNKLDLILKELTNNSSDKNSIARTLYEHYAKSYAQDHPNELRELLGPTLNNIGLPRS